jgi:VWFA-related protein
MFKGARLSRLLIFPLLFTVATSGQQASPPADVANSRMYLDVVVTDKSGQSITDLQQGDFTLLDNKAPQTISSFESVNGRQAPIEVVVVIDAVNIGYQNIAFQRGQIEKFLRDEGGNLAYPLALAVFGDTGTKVVAGFSSDGNALSASLDKEQIGLRDIGRSAGYYGATERLQLSLNAMGQVIGSLTNRPGRKILIWVSPGWALLSGPRMELDAKQEQQIFANVVRLSTQLRKANITLYSIDPGGPSGSVTEDWTYEQYVKGITKPAQAQLGDLALQVLSVQSGGVAFNFTNGIADRLHKCIADSVPYYEISFDPPPATKADEYHAIQIKLAKSGLVARTRQGYYGQALQQ